jgi:hypothetical protein
MKLKINASDVASLIGEHPYRKQQETFRVIAMENKLIDEEVDDVDETLETLLQSEVQNVVACTNKTEFEQKAKQYETRATEVVLKDFLLKQRNEEQIFKKTIQTTPELKQQIAKYAEERDVNVAVQKLMNDKEVTKLIAKEPEIQHAQRSINRIRGNMLEETSTNIFERSIEQPISQRNTKCYIYEGTNYKLCGRVDGLTQDSIVETKTRRRFWKEAPAYDLIQLRCYLRLTNRKMGTLNEVFPDNTQRATSINWDEREWNLLDQKIVNALETLKRNFNN